MPDSAHLQMLQRALEELLESSTRSDVGASLRRLGWSMARDGENPPEVRDAAEDVMLESGDARVEAARRLLETLKRVEAGAEDADRESVQRHAMLLEQDAEASGLMARMLKAAGWRVTLRTTGGGVVDQLHDDPAHLLVVDVFLADCDGRDVIVDLAQSESTENIPILALAPESQRESLTKSECLALGAGRFLRRSELKVRFEGAVADLTGTPVGDDDATSTSEASGAGDAPPGPIKVLSKGQLIARFRGREAGGDRGALGLLQLPELRTIAEAHGPDRVDELVGELALAVAEAAPSIRMMGRWATLQIVAVLPDVGVDAAAEELEAALGAVGERPWPEEMERVLREMEFAVVQGPDGSSVAAPVTTASEVRLGLSNDGLLVRPTGRAEPSRVPRIAVVEDDPVTQALVVHKLKHAGFEVTPFSDGNKAAEAFVDGGFDLYLLDINLPGRDGFDIIRQLRYSSLTRETPILVLSGMGSDSDVVRGLDLGADDYMLKPFSPVELTARVRRLLSSASS